MATEQYTSIGRRKTAVARIHMRPGKGSIIINGKPAAEYFGKREGFADTISAPLKETQTLGKYDLVINVQGGGVKGQVEAIRHGCARALEKANPAFRPTLKSLGFFTRDPREKERRKYGLAKARKAYQFSKR